MMKVFYQNLQHTYGQLENKFLSGNFNVKGTPRLGKLIIEKVDEIFQKIEEGQQISPYGITVELNINQKAVLNQLHKAGYKKNLEI